MDLKQLKTGFMNKFTSKLKSGFLKFRKIIALPFQIIFLSIAVLSILLFSFVDYALFVNNANVLEILIDEIISAKKKEIEVEKKELRRIHGKSFIKVETLYNDKKIDKAA